MTNLERAEMHRDKVEMELAEAKDLHNLLMGTTESTLHTVEEMEAEVKGLEKELAEAKDAVTVAVHFEAFKSLSSKELRGLIKSETVDWKVKNAALDVSAWKAERACERRVS